MHKELLKQRDTIQKLNQEFIDELINKIYILDEKIVKQDNDINILKNENDSLKEDIIKYNKEVENFKIYINALELKIKQLEEDKFNQWNIVENIEKSLIEEEFDNIEKILDYAIKNINKNEDNLSEEEIIILSYLAFFYSKLDSLKLASREVEAYLISNNEAAIALRLLEEEKNVDVGLKIKNCYQKFILNNKKIFEINNTIRKFILDTTLDNCCKYFDKAQIKSKIEIDEKLKKINAFVECNDGVVLVEGYIGSEKNKLFILREIAKKIAYNTSIVIETEDLSPIVFEKVENIKRKFLGLGTISTKNILRISKENKLRNDFDFIKKYELKLADLNEEQIYSLYIISIFYNVYNELIDNLNGLERFLDLDTYENRFVEVIENQIINDEHNITVYNFIEENRENIIKVDKVLLEHIFKIAKKHLPINYIELVQVNEVPTYCLKHKVKLEKNVFVIELINPNKNENNERKRVVGKIDSCPQCKIAYINEESVELLNNQYPGYKCKVNNGEHKIRNILYKESLNSYINRTPAITKKNILKIINDENLIKDLSRTQVSTLMILGSFLGIGSTQLELSFKPHRFGIGY